MSLFSQELILSSLPGAVNYTREIRGNNHETETHSQHEIGKEIDQRAKISENVERSHAPESLDLVDQLLAFSINVGR